MIMALVLALAGNLLRRPYLAWVGVVLTLPMGLYLSGSPAYPLSGLIPVSALGIAAGRCRDTQRWQAYTGIVIYALFLVALASLVLNEAPH